MRFPIRATLTTRRPSAIAIGGSTDRSTNGLGIRIFSSGAPSTWRSSAST